jgi:hypothetical protein
MSAIRDIFAWPLDRLQKGVAKEIETQIHLRLLSVISRTRFEMLPRPYGWRAIGSDRLPEGAIAAVRDGVSWYALTEVSPIGEGAYRVFAFHFDENISASGFVAWLASLVKAQLGTGVMVVCGFDSRNSPSLWQASFGLFDYWGCPWDKGADVLALIEKLRREGNESEPNR